MREMVSLFALCEPVCAATVWVSWYRFCMDWERRYGVSFTHLGVASDSLHPEGIRTRRRYLSKVEAAIAQNEGMESLEFYLLPEKFCLEVFDFWVYLGLSLRRQGYCEITVEKGF